MAKRKGNTRGKSVRRRDKNGNAYFVDRESGRRVSRETWEKDQRRVRRARERERVAREAEAVKKPPQPPKRSPPTPTRPDTPKPFPDDVVEPGYPIGDDGEYLDDAFAIEGEDET